MELEELAGKRLNCYSVLSRGTKFKDGFFNDFRKDKEVVMYAVSVDGTAIEFCDEGFKKDKDVALSSVQKNGWTILKFDEAIQNDLDVVYQACKKHPGILKYTNEDFQDNKELAMECLSKEGLLLEFVSDRLKADLDVCLEAVTNNPKSIHYAGKAIRSLCGYCSLDDVKPILFAEKLKNTLQRKPAEKQVKRIKI